MLSDIGLDLFCRARQSKWSGAPNAVNFAMQHVDVVHHDPW
jgi:hypothetical protein